MNEILRISGQMTQAFEGGAWHGPALLEILDGIGAETAAARPIASAHTIWEIVLHLAATQKLMLWRMDGAVRELEPEEDWPPLFDATEERWRETIELLQKQERQFRAAVERFPARRLDLPLIPGGSSAYNNFHGYVQHTLYHAAQLMLLKKAVTG